MVEHMLKRYNFKVKAGMTILLIIFFIAIFAPLIAPHNPYELGIPYERPSSEHLLGTNDIGQDILSELIYGTRISLIIGLVSACAVTFLGVFIGLVSGYYGGKIDKIIVQLINVVMSIPSLPLTIILVAFLETGIWNIIIAICITAWTGTARIIRSRVMQLKELPFIKIEKTMGAGDFYIMFVHILPNIGETVFIRGVSAVSSAMLTEASLSFLGLGVIGTKSWGGILHYAFFRNGIINGYIWWYLPPMICISISVLGFILLSYYNEKPLNKNRKKIRNEVM